MKKLIIILILFFINPFISFAVDEDKPPVPEYNEQEYLKYLDKLKNSESSELNNEMNNDIILTNSGENINNQDNIILYNYNSYIIFGMFILNIILIIYIIYEKIRIKKLDIK